MADVSGCWDGALIGPISAERRPGRLAGTKWLHFPEIRHLFRLHSVGKVCGPFPAVKGCFELVRELVAWLNPPATHRALST
jgi:hypothetical protein